MHSSFPAFDNVRRSQLWQPFEPEAGRLSLAMAEHPRLNDLVRFPDGGADDTDRVLDADHWYRRIHQNLDEL